MKMLGFFNKKLFLKEELFPLVLSIITLTIVFGFDDGQDKLVLINWIKNFFIVFGLVIISFMFRILIVKYWAFRHDSEMRYKILNITRFGFKHWERFDKKIKEKSFLPSGIPIGIILAYTITLLSLGKWYFTAIGENDITINRNARAGRKHIDLATYEDAIIQLSAPFSNVFLVVLGTAIGAVFLIDVSMFIKMNLFLALFSMIPFSRLEGAKIFFGSRNLYVFGLAVIVLGFLFKNFGIVGAVLLSLIMAAVITGAYYFNWEND